MFSNSGLAPNCMVMFAVESTGKAFASGDLINRAFYHCAGGAGASRRKTDRQSCGKCYCFSRNRRNMADWKYFLGAKMGNPAASTRLHAFDNLRATMMWLGIVLHVCVNH